jgi:hypothetical protein
MVSSPSIPLCIAIAAWMCGCASTSATHDALGDAAAAPEIGVIGPRPAQTSGTSEATPAHPETKLAQGNLGIPLGTILKGSAEDMNLSNNPLKQQPSIELRDYYASDLFGSDNHANDALFRGTLPIARDTMPQLLRLTIPISTRPDVGGDNTSGLGDINIADLFVFGDSSSVQIGIGPQLTIPSATDDLLGTDRWQAGLVATAVKPTPAGLFGLSMQWQTSFAGPSSAGDFSTFTLQPLLFFNLDAGWYLRSTAEWQFDLEHGRYFVPIGIGGGAIWKHGKNIFNAFIEPQITVAHDGDGLPQFALLFGLDTTFG